MPESQIKKSDTIEDDIPFGRSRMLKTLGLFLFGGVISACGNGSSQPCQGTLLQQCSTGCSGYKNTVYSSTTAHCYSGTGCWEQCNGSNKWKCCDYDSPGLDCWCGGIIGTCP